MSKKIEFKHIFVEKVPEGNYAVIYLNRPERLNAIQTLTSKEIYSALEPFEYDRKVRCVVIRGTKDFTKKPAFSAGGDMGGERPAKGFKNTPVHQAHDRYKMQVYYDLIEEFNKPLIAAVDGYAFGAGCELTLCCDLVIASKRSLFGFPEITRGMFPGAGGTQRMVRRIGLARATQMIYYGEHYSAEKMQEWGHVDYIAEEGEDFEKLVHKRASMLGNSPTTSLYVVKKCLKFGTQVPLKIGLIFEQLGFGINSASKDFMEGIQAFMQKRETKFTGGI